MEFEIISPGSLLNAGALIGINLNLCELYEVQRDCMHFQRFLFRICGFKPPVYEIYATMSKLGNELPNLSHLRLKVWRNLD